MTELLQQQRQQLQPQQHEEQPRQQQYQFNHHSQQHHHSRNHEQISPSSDSTDAFRDKNRTSPYTQTKFTDPRAGPGRCEDRALLHPVTMGMRHAPPFEDPHYQKSIQTSPTVNDISQWPSNTSRSLGPYSPASVRSFSGDAYGNTLPPLRTKRTPTCERCRKYGLEVRL